MIQQLPVLVGAGSLPTGMRSEDRMNLEPQVALIQARMELESQVALSQGRMELELQVALPGKNGT